ncbi:lipase/esterase [Exophiala viscosa]|uniref:lipase/esterase n=1 Tax=Exophiala viscosa TaxID=2486360 RepID=UPI00218CA101|nr:lipase/esterase [Exophiala viscosa]
MEYEEIHNISYVRDGHERQKLDLYLPPKGTTLSPVIVYIHGGAFMYGNKETELIPKHMRDRGYAIASLDYRLSGDATSPAAVEDCKAAVRWLRANAERYRLDPDRVVAWGESAGGHLAAMIGATGDIKEFDVGEYLDVSSAVQGVVDYYGPTDFLQMDDHAPPGSQMHNHANSPESRYIGGNITEHPDKVKRANPMTYVSASTPPFFIAHGTDDHLVPFHQSTLLGGALKRANVPITFHPVVGADHVFRGASVEQRQSLQKATEEFLDSLWPMKASE